MRSGRRPFYSAVPKSRHCFKAPVMEVCLGSLPLLLLCHGTKSRHCVKAPVMEVCLCSLPLLLLCHSTKSWHCVKAPVMELCLGSLPLLLLCQGTKSRPCVNPPVMEVCLCSLPLSYCVTTLNHGHVSRHLSQKYLMAFCQGIVWWKYVTALSVSRNYFTAACHGF